VEKRKAQETTEKDRKRQKTTNSEPIQTFEQRLHRRETDPHRLQTRKQQIDKGYNTNEYRRYKEEVPLDRRIRGNDKHPKTPDRYQVCSKRSFDGQLRKWRRLLHQWDPAVEETQVDYVSNQDLEELAALLGEGPGTSTTGTSEDKKPNFESDKEFQQVGVF